MARALSEIVPTRPAPPAEVISALERCERMRERLAVERTTAEQAAASVVKAEQGARERLAATFASGAEPKSDVEAPIVKAKAASEMAQRRFQACELAVADVEAELRGAIERAAPEWAQTVRTEVAARGEDARRALSDLRAALDARAEVQAVGVWLADPRALDGGHAPRVRGLGSATSTRAWAANADPIEATRLLDALGELLVDPPVRPVEPVHHQRNQWPAVGPAIVGGPS